MALLFDAPEQLPLSSAVDALAALEADPDILEENAAPETREAREERHRATEVLASPTKIVPLNVIASKHKGTSETRQLLLAAGGLPALRRFTARFYERCFADPFIDKFIASHSDPHAERFATWLAEKLGDGTPWTEERQTRKRTYLRIGYERYQVAHDRSSAHFAAWHCHKRPPHELGEHFKPDDARVWMRLHFWAARETGLFEQQAFIDYYIRFIAHFVSVYSSKSPPFARESARWSADPLNLKRYAEAGNMMSDVIGKPIEKALAELPAEERAYTGSRHSSPAWPYELRPLA